MHSKKFFKFLGLGLVCFGFFSCADIGLGNAVDTEKPEISIIEPTADYKVRDTFTMRGSWSDDLALKSVSVYLKDTTSGKQYGPFSAEAVTKGQSDEKTEGEWTCVLNKKDDEISFIPDGSYKATVIAEDTYKHKSEASQGFSIDNTAPLIVLQSPSSTTIENANEFGQVFKIEGKAADDSDVDSIDFIFYDAEENELHRSSKSGVGTQIDLTVAEFGDDVYNKIYGENKEAGTKAYSLKMIVYDSARKVPAEEGDKGNGTEYFYLWDELEKEIGKVSTALGYKITSGREDSVTEDKTLIEEWQKSLAEKSHLFASFALNPVNNPYFEIQRFESFTEGEAELNKTEFTDGNSVSINIYRGRDNKQVLKNTIGVYLQECDSTGVVIEGRPEITLLQPYCDKDENVITGENGKELISEEEHNQNIKEIGSSTISVSVDIAKKDFDVLEPEKFYRIRVTAFDISKNEVRNDADKNYGFKFMIPLSAPILTVETKSNEYQKAYTQLVIKGTVSDSEGTLVCIKDGEEIPVTVDTENPNMSGEEILSYNWSYTFTTTNEGGDLVFQAKNKYNQSDANSKKTFRYFVDEDAPLIQITELAGVSIEDMAGKEAYANTGVYYSVKGTVSEIGESGLDEFIYYTVCDGYSEPGIIENDKGKYFDISGWEKALITKTADCDVWKADVDFSQKTDGKSYTVYFAAKDVAGNVSLCKKIGSEEYISNIKTTVVLDSEAPVFLPKEIGPAIYHESVGGSLKIYAIVGDAASGMSEEASKAVKLIVNDRETTYPATVEETSYEINDTKKYSKYEFSVDDDGSSLTYTVKALDKAGNIKIYGEKQTVDISAPIITLDSGIKENVQDSNGVNFTNSQFEIKYTVTSNGNGIQKFSYKKGDTETVVWQKTEGSSDNKTVISSEDNDAVKILVEKVEQSGRIDLTFTAVNIYGGISEKTFSCNFDLDSPQLENIKCESSKSDSSGKEYFDAEKTLEVSGNANEGGDALLQSGISSVEYALIQGKLTDGTAIPSDTKWESTIGTGSWKIKHNLEETAEEGDYTLFIRATDNVGNETVSSPIYLIADRNPPVIKSSEFKAPAFIEDNLVFTVVARDEIFGIESAVISNNSKNLGIEPVITTTEIESTEDGVQTSETFEVYTFTLKKEQANLIEGKNSFNFTFKDHFGKTSTLENPIIIENNAPTFSNQNSGIPADAYKVSKEDENTEFQYVKETFESKAKVSISGENNILSDIKYADTYKNGEETITLSSDSLILDSENGIILGFDKTEGYEGKFVTRTINVTNIYGLSKSWEIRFVFDTIAPALIEDDLKVGGIDYDLENLIWYNTESVNFSGSYLESGSGIDAIEYEITFADGRKSSGKIFTTDTGAVKKFNSTLSGFTEGSIENSVKFKALDKAGNVSAEKTVLVKTDTTSPKNEAALAPTKESGEKSALWYKLAEGEWKPYTNTILTNNEKTLVIAGKFVDLPNQEGNQQSGVKCVYANINGKTLNAAKIEESDYYQIEIKAEDIPEVGSYSGNIIIEDNAGNKDSSLNFAVLVDTSSPEAKIESPTADSVLNGIVSLSGKVFENNNPKSIEFYYFFAENSETQIPLALTGWIPLTDGQEIPSSLKKSVENGDSIGDVSNWKFDNVNINKVLDGKESGILYILPIAFDEAENVNINIENIPSSAYTKVNLDLNSDRPIIKLTNLGFENGVPAKFIKYSSKLSGSITDDDGISKFYVANMADKTDVPSSSDWKEVSVSSGSFEIELGEDGQKNIWFKVQDSFGAEFVTTAEKGINRPYIVYNGNLDENKNEIKSDNNSVLSFITDSNAPVIKKINYLYGENDGSLANETLFDTSKTNLVGGLKRRFVSFVLELEDNGSGIDENSVTVSGLSDIPLYLSFDSETSKYKSAAFDVSNIYGTKTLTFSILDKAGIETKETRSLTADNSAPSANLINPGVNSEKGETDIVTGEIELKGTAADEYSTVEKVNYLILNDSFYDENGVVADKETILSEAKKAVCVNSNSATSWIFCLNGKEGFNPKLPSSDEELSPTESGKTGYTKVPHDENDIYSMQLYIYTEDSLGNCDISEPVTLKYNPFGDRPVTEVVYPESVFKNEEGIQTPAADLTNVNGSIRVTGSAIDNISIGSGKVFIQLDVNNDGEFTEADYTALNTSLSSLEEGKTTGYSLVEDITKTSGKDFSAIKNEEKWGILVKGTNNWNITLNSVGELRFSGAMIGDGQYKIGLRAVAVDDTGVFGNWSSSKYFMIDENAPSISSSEIVNQKDSSAEGLVSKAYSQDMYLRGTQFLKLKIKDKTGIKKVTYHYESNLDSIKVDSPSVTLEGAELPAPENADGFAEYTVYIPVSELAKTSGFNGKLALKVTAIKDSDTETSTYERYVMSFDDEKPEFVEVKLNSDTASTTDALANRIVNNNGTFFTLGGKIKDEGSGYEKIAFYYWRKDVSSGKGDRVYDSLFNDSYVKISELTQDEETKLYCFTQNAVISDNGATITLETDNEHIRAGGLVQINNVWHTISAKSDNVLTLATMTTSTGSVSALFPVAQVIDNTGSEKTDADGELTAGDDGDGMPESIIKSGTYWSFDASIHSNYIPDGPGNLVLAVWDKAGNVSVQEYGACVQNNAPRLTKLWLGTDLSSDGFSEKEFAEYDVLAKVGAKSSYEMKTADYSKRFRIKGDLAVVGEFTGGNNAGNSTDGSRIKMVYNNAAGSETYVTKNTDGTNFYKSVIPNGENESVNSLENNSFFNHSDETNFTDLTNFAYVIPKDKLGEDSTQNADGFTKRAMSFTFWDDTEETTQGTDSCYAFLKITDLIVMVKDSFAPRVAIDPFFWKSPEENSLFNNSFENGHIDLPSDEKSSLDLTTGLFKDESGNFASGKPKVSGIVSVRGTAIDEHTLDSIWIAFTKKDNTSVFTPTSGFYEDDSSVEGYYKVAQKNSETKQWETKETSAAGTTLGFAILSSETTTEGEIVNWQLDIDTSSMTGACGNDVMFKVLAKDAAEDSLIEGGKHSSSETNTTTSLEQNGKYDIKDESVNISSYTVDVVPYVSGIKDATRSRLGRYSVREGETITINGFNFPETTPAISLHKTDGLKTADLSGVTRVNATTLTATAPSKSGFINVAFGDITVPNNSNENIAYNISNGYSALENDCGRAKAAESGNNFWTDDVYLSVWNTTTSFEGSINPHSGVIRKVREEDTIKNSGSIGIKEKGSEILPTESMTDSYYGFISSDDMRPYLYETTTQHMVMCPTADVSLFTAPVDAVDSIILGGLPYFVLQTNYVGNTNANCWGPGLILSREGFSYQREVYETTTGLSEGKLPWIIERQGNTNSAMNRDSSTGYDSVLYQFKNLRMAGWHTDSPIEDDKTKGNNIIYDRLDYIYVTYYDSYAKCLKYAAFRSGTTVDASNKISVVPQNDPNSQWGGGATSDYSLVAEVRSANGNMTNGATVVAGHDWNKKDAPTNFTEKAGEWSDIVLEVDETNNYPIPVIVYYNETKRCLEVARGKTSATNRFPKSTNYGQKEVTSLTGEDAWTKTEITPDSSSDFGRYVSACIDGAGNLHVAAQDATNAKLYYLYLTKNGETYELENSVVVDSSSGAGRWTDIELTNPNGTTVEECKPVISYINTSYLGTTQGAKVAYFDSADAEGNLSFEAMTSPAVWQVSDQRTSVLPDVKETKNSTEKAKVAIGFNSDMLALDFLRDE